MLHLLRKEIVKSTSIWNAQRTQIFNKKAELIRNSIENDVLFVVYYRLISNLPNPLDLELANFLVPFVAWLRKVLLIAKCTFEFTLEKNHIVVRTVTRLSHKLEIEISMLKPSVCKIPIVLFSWCWYLETYVRIMLQWGKLKHSQNLCALFLNNHLTLRPL